MESAVCVTTINLFIYKKCKEIEIIDKNTQITKLKKNITGNDAMYGRS